MNQELEEAILESSEPERKPFDAKEVEKEMLEIANNRTEDPAETAAMVYHMYRPELLKRLPKLSSRGKTRILEALVQYPLNGSNKFPNELEQEIYMIADSMIQARFCLMMDTYKDGAEQLVKAQDEFIFNKEEAEKLNKEGE